VQVGEKIVEIDDIDVSPSESPSLSSMWAFLPSMLAAAFCRRCAVDVPETPVS
jgi:hypothetical protein